MAAENTAQARDAKSGNVCDTSVQIVAREFAAPQSIVNFVGVGVVIAGDPPDLRVLECLGKHLFKRCGRLKIAQDHHCVGLVFPRGFVDVIERAVRITAKKDVRQFSLTHRAMVSSGTTPFLLLGNFRLLTHEPTLLSDYR